MHEQNLRKKKEQQEQNRYAVLQRNTEEHQAGGLERLLEFNNKLEIRRPIAEVFQFLSNFENMSKWNYFVVNVKKISDGPVGINTAFKQKRKTDSQEYRIIEYDPNKRVAIEIQPPSVKLTMRFTLQPSHDDNRTVVVDEWKFDTGIPALFARIRVNNVKAAVAENLEKLKELLETGKTILQDGREERV